MALCSDRLGYRQNGASDSISPPLLQLALGSAPLSLRGRTGRSIHARQLISFALPNRDRSGRYEDMQATSASRYVVPSQLVSSTQTADLVSVVHRSMSP